MHINLVVLNVSLVEGMAGSMRVKNLVEPLVEFDNIVVSNLALTHTYETDKIGKKGINEKIEYLYIGYKKATNIKQVYNFYAAGIRFLREAFRKDHKNVIYNYGYPDIKNLPLLIFARYKGYKVLFDIVEDNRFIREYSGVLGWLRMKSSIILIKQTKRLADAVIVISEHLKGRMDKVTKGNVPVYHIPITVNFKYFPTPSTQINSGRIQIFYGGSFYLAKDGIIYLINAFNKVSKKYSNIYLILSGMSVVKSEMDLIMEMIKENEKILYKGYLSTNEYYSVLNEADIFCMPRNNSAMAHAGFPFKLGEFLAAGKAIIATKVGDVPLYLHDKKNAILIEPESEEEIESAIILCIEDPGLRQAMGKEARATALKYFDSTILSSTLLRVFENL